MKIFIRVIKIAVVCAVLFVAVSGAYYWLETRPPENLRTRYQTQAAAIANVNRQVIATGRVQPADTYRIILDVTEKVSRAHVKEGDPVSVDQPLLDYDIATDMENLERQLAEAQLNRENAEINLENIALPAGGTELVQYTADVTASRQNIFTAENDIKSTEIKLALQQRKLDDAGKMLENNTILHQNGVITQNEYDLAVTALASAEQSMADLNLQREANAQTLATRQAQYADAEQKLANAQNKLSDKATANKHRQQQNAIALIQLQMDQIQSELSKIVAHSVSPIDGYITAVHIKSGEIASKGAALIEIADTARMQVNVDLTEYDAPRVQIGQKANISTSAIPNTAYEGAITKIAVGAVESAGSDDDDAKVPIEITILNLDEYLKPGYTVDVSVVTDEKEDVLSVPIQAIVLEGVNRFVYLMHTRPAVRRVFWKTVEFEESTLTKAPVVTGLYGDKTVEIVSGIRAGDPVVINVSDIDLSAKPFFDWETLRKKLPWNKNLSA